MSFAGHLIGGVRIRAAPGPVRDKWLRILERLRSAGSTMMRVPSSVPVDRLLGGVDIAGTMAAGRILETTGILASADGGAIVLPMAERMQAATAGIIAGALDLGSVETFRKNRVPTRFSVIALDEGIDTDETLPDALATRLGIHLDLNGLSIRDIAIEPDGPVSCSPDIDSVALSEPMLAALSEASLADSSRSLRRLVLLVRLARACAALDGSSEVGVDHAAAAIRLSFGTSPTVQTETQEADAEDDPHDADAPPETQERQEPQSDVSENQADTQNADPDEGGDELEISAKDASRAVIEALTASHRGKAARRAQAGKAGAANARSRRGRPIGVSTSPPYPEARPDIAATLRTALPWQRLRRLEAGQEAWVPGTPLIVLKSDFRYLRYRHRSQSAAIFAVDASGSTAMERLAEAKGAIELLLAECYVRRDSVALIAFRGRQAELLLEPTRSLVRAKRSLSGMPGGGATPLADGIRSALSLGDKVLRRGQSPVIIYLTDGSGNITLEGKADRSLAGEQAHRLARIGAADGFRSIVIDITARPRKAARELATAMQAEYSALPHMTASAVSQIVGRYMSQAG